MRLCRFTPAGEFAPREGEVREQQVVAFEAGTVLDRIATGDRRPASGPSWPLSEVRLEAPIASPRQIFCVGLNYADHAAEAGMEAPSAPAIFIKASTSVTGPSGPISCPPAVRRLDYEAELAVVIGTEGTVAGYAVANDVSGRDLQKRERHWTRAKGAATFCPWGPWITTADEGVDVSDLEIRSWVNGEPRQQSRTSAMIFGVDEVLAFIAETCELLPGDLLLTGTPAGVGFAMDPPRFLAAGDSVRIEIEGLGRIEQRVEAG